MFRERYIFQITSYDASAGRHPGEGKAVYVSPGDAFAYGFSHSFAIKILYIYIFHCCCFFASTITSLESKMIRQTTLAALIIIFVS